MLFVAEILVPITCVLINQSSDIAHCLLNIFPIFTEKNTDDKGETNSLMFSKTHEALGQMRLPGDDKKKKKKNPFSYRCFNTTRFLFKELDAHCLKTNRQTKKAQQLSLSQKLLTLPLHEDSSKTLKPKLNAWHFNLTISQTYSAWFWPLLQLCLLTFRKLATNRKKKIMKDSCFIHHFFSTASHSLKHESNSTCMPTGKIQIHAKARNSGFSFPKINLTCQHRHTGFNFYFDRNPPLEKHVAIPFDPVMTSTNATSCLT